MPVILCTFTILEIKPQIFLNVLTELNSKSTAGYHNHIFMKITIFQARDTAGEWRCLLLRSGMPAPALMGDSRVLGAAPACDLRWGRVTWPLENSSGLLW